MRRAIADGTVRSKSNTPHFYVTVEADVAPLLALRAEINSALAERGIKVSVNDMLIKALALSLRAFPNLNTHYYGDRFVRHERVNIGIAVALPENGLVNVVCHDADKIALSEMADSNKAMYERARGGRIQAGRHPRRHLHHQQYGSFQRQRLFGHHQRAGSGHSGSVIVSARAGCASGRDVGRRRAHEYDA